MLAVDQFRYGADNLGYVIHGGGEALIVDGGAVDEILAFLQRNGLNVRAIVNTHGHSDHTTGNNALRIRTGAQLLEPGELDDGAVIYLGGETVRVLRTPGHSRDSLCLYAGNALLTGDTLFNGTIGNCFTGDLRAFYESIRKLMAFPPDTIVYAGHDYVNDSIAFARRLEPDNGELERFLDRYDPGLVCSTLAEEALINPYLRFNEPSIIALMKSRGLPTGTEWERWQSLMSVE